MNSEPRSNSSTEYRNGLLFGLACYVSWGLLPLFFIAIEFASPLEIVANRAVWTLLFCVLLLLCTGRLKELGQALRKRRQLMYLSAAAALIGVNWFAYVYAVTQGQVLQASLGYFINPLITVLLGVVVLHERLRKAQWLAMAVGMLAMLVIVVSYGHPPWLALAMAFSFAFYGLAKNFAGRETGAIASLAIEALLLTPIALLIMLWLARNGQAHFIHDGNAHTLLLLSTGVVTAVPLTLFAAAARRLPLSMLGMLQYLGPSMHFVIAVYIQHEVMPSTRWLGFALIWLALVIISTDAIRQSRRKRLLRQGEAAIQSAS